MIPAHNGNMRDSMIITRAGMGLIFVLSTASASAAELAKVNGRSVTDKDVRAALGTLNAGQQSTLLADPNARRQILLNVIDQELIAQEAEKAKLDQDQEFKEAYAVFRKQFLANRQLNRVLTPKLTESAVRKYYDAHKVQFNTDTARVQHILLADEAQAKSVAALAKQKDADFQALAEKYSKDPTVKNNRGDLGLVARGQMVPEFNDAVFGAGEGEIIGPVRTAFGYHIIKIVQKQVGKTLPYDQVELTAKNALQKDLLNAYAAGLKKTAKIEINEPALKALK